MADVESVYYNKQYFYPAPKDYSDYSMKIPSSAAEHYDPASKTDYGINIFQNSSFSSIPKGAKSINVKVESSVLGSDGSIYLSFSQVESLSGSSAFMATLWVKLDDVTLTAP